MCTMTFCAIESLLERVGMFKLTKSERLCLLYGSLLVQVTACNLLQYTLHYGFESYPLIKSSKTKRQHSSYCKSNIIKLEFSCK